MSSQKLRTRIKGLSLQLRKTIRRKHWKRGGMLSFNHWHFTLAFLWHLQSISMYREVLPFGPNSSQLSHYELLLCPAGLEALLSSPSSWLLPIQQLSLLGGLL